MFLIYEFTSLTSNAEIISFGICFVIGVVAEIIYQYSCDKIDYNTLVEKNDQINIFEWMNENNQFIKR